MAVKALGWDVLTWPECKAFLVRLGVDTSQPIRRLELSVGIHEMPIIKVETFGRDMSKHKVDAANG